MIKKDHPYYSDFEKWTQTKKWSRTPEGNAAKLLAWEAWVNARDTMHQNVLDNKPLALSPEQLNKKVDLMGSNLQGQFFSFSEKTEKDIEDLRDQLELLSGKLQMLQQNLVHIASRPVLDMTKY